MSRAWPQLSVAIAVVVLGIVAVDMAGYRYAAAQLGRSSALSLATVVVLLTLYAGLMRGLTAVASHRRWATATAAPGEEAPAEADVAQRVRTFTRLVFLVGGALLVASYWGLDRQGFQALEQMQVYPVGEAVADDEGLVSAAELLLFVLTLVVTTWLVRNLAGIYEVTNWTRGDAVLRVVVDVGVAYGSDVDEVARTLDEVARDDPDVLDDSEPSVVFMKHGESSLDFALRVYIASPAVMMVITDRLNKQINQTFRRRGIEIPFPQRVLHFRPTAVRLTDGRPVSTGGETAASSGDGG